MVVQHCTLVDRFFFAIAPGASRQLASAHSSARRSTLRVRDIVNKSRTVLWYVMGVAEISALSYFCFAFFWKRNSHRSPTLPYTYTVSEPSRGRSRRRFRFLLRHTATGERADATDKRGPFGAAGGGRLCSKSLVSLPNSTYIQGTYSVFFSVI